MTNRPTKKPTQDAIKLLARVRQILIRDWHPIGAPIPPNEYDAFAAAITGMLLRDCTTVELVNYLAQSEAYILGETSIDIKRRVSVAMRLRELLG